MELDDDLRGILDAFRHVVQATRNFSSDSEEKVGLTGAQLFALQAIANHGPLSVNSLAQRTLTHQSSVSVVARRLVDKGLVTREQSPTDGRQMLLSATRRGQGLAQRSPDAVQDRIIVALKELSPTERKRLATLLARVVHGLDLTGKHPPMFFSDTPDSNAL